MDYKMTTRKRKIFIGERVFASLVPLMQKHSDSKFLLPCSDLLKGKKNKTMEESGLDYTKAVMYKVDAADLSDLSDVKYDILVFFSPTGIKSLTISCAPAVVPTLNEWLPEAESSGSFLNDIVYEV